MVIEYGVQNNKWLNGIYNLHHKWSIGFNNDTFHCGIKSTSWSDTTNDVLNELGDKTTSLYKFVKGFEKLDK